MIVACALSALARVKRRYRPSHLVSLLAPGQSLPESLSTGPVSLMLCFNDIGEARPPLIAPSASDIERLIAFARGWTCQRPMVIHCFAGVSRSSAAAYIVACMRSPGREDEIARELRSRAPFATPNVLMTALGDELLGRQGRMIAAVERIGRGTDVFEGTPYELTANDSSMVAAG